MIDVALATDNAYLPHAATVIRSLLASNDPRGVTAHILHPPEVGADAIRRLGQMVSRNGGAARFYEIGGSEVQGLPSMGRISHVMWYRLLLPQLLSAIERALYVDCDTLIVDDISPLWALDLQENPVAAVTNVFPRDLAHRPRELGLSEDQYFNSGVLLMDLDVWRRTRCSESIARVARDHPGRLVFPDQDALNLVLASRRLPLEPRWNAQNAIFYFPWATDTFGSGAVAQARRNPAVVHFEGPAQAKPWHLGSNHPYRRTYLEYRRQTPWPRVRFEGGSLPRRLGRRLLARQG